MNINKLKELEKSQNNGRGVSCIRTIIIFLEHNKLDEALNCCYNENDKIRNYPEIKQLLQTILPDYKT
jgi:hypothetical protein